MSYRPKRVFVKTENGAYTEITFQEFKTRRKTDTAYNPLSTYTESLNKVLYRCFCLDKTEKKRIF